LGGHPHDFMHADPSLALGKIPSPRLSFAHPYYPQWDGHPDLAGVLAAGDPSGRSIDCFSIAFVYSLQSADLSAQLGRIPILGAILVDAFNTCAGEAHEVMGMIKNLIPMMGRFFGRLLVGLSDQVIQLFMTGVALFFFLKDGKRILESLKEGLIRLLGMDVAAYFRIIQSTVFAVSFGIMGAALLQGLIATCGYVVFGLKTPLLLGLLSMIASLVPVVGAFLVWGPLVMGFILENHFAPAIGLTLWGLLIVHPADNILRPWVIGKLMHSPILLMLLGVVGGILSLGLKGLFLGPCILAILFHLWHSFTHAEVTEPTQ